MRQWGNNEFSRKGKKYRQKYLAAIVELFGDKEGSEIPLVQAKKNVLVKTSGKTSREIRVKEK